MATLDASGNTDALDMTAPSLVAFGSYISQSPSELAYLAADGTTIITLTGTFTYNGSQLTSGTVSLIEIDISGDLDVDISISYSPSETPAALGLLGSNDNFWLAALSGSDTLVPATSPAPGFIPAVYIGDFLNLAGGETLVAGGDLFEYPGGAGSIQLFADGVSNSGTLIGGEDSVSFVAIQPTGSVTLGISSNTSIGTFTGGDDVLRSTAPATINATSTFSVYGDAISNFGSLTGGNDDIDVLYATQVKVWGDVRQSNSGSVQGGNDAIYGSNYTNDTLYGDAEILAGTIFTGGDDYIDGRRGDDTIILKEPAV